MKEQATDGKFIWDIDEREGEIWQWIIYIYISYKFMRHYQY